MAGWNIAGMSFSITLNIIQLVTQIDAFEGKDRRIDRGIPQIGGNCFADAKQSRYDQQDVDHGCRLILSSSTDLFDVI